MKALYEPLNIDGTKIVSIPITPTKEGATIVIVLESLCTQAIADAIGLNLLYDGNGVLNSFQGTISPEGGGQLSGAVIDFVTKTGKHNAQFKTQKISHFTVKKVENDAFVSFRVHLAGADEKSVLADLQRLFRINKAECQVTILDEQGSLFEKGDPDTPNVADRVIPMAYSAEVGKSGSLKMRLLLAPEAQDRWFWGYDITWTGPRAPMNVGKIVNIDSNDFCVDRTAAVHAAARGCVEAFKEQTGEYDGAQLKASAAAMDWLLEQAPGLMKDQSGNPVVINIDRKPDPVQPEEPLGDGPPPRGRRGGPKNRLTH